MSFGMAFSVAPLTTTVMTAVEDRHAGVASGINNAVSRTAGLISIAVLGIVMMAAFTRNFGERIRQIDLSANIREELKSQSGSLAAIAIPNELQDATKEEIKRAVDESFVYGFRSVVMTAAILALISSSFAWILIEGKAPSKNHTQREA